MTRAHPTLAAAGASLLALAAVATRRRHNARPSPAPVDVIGEAMERAAPGPVESALLAAEERDHRVAAATHDLLNALAGLTGYLELLGDEPATDSARALQHKAQELATRVILLSEDLLVQATAGSGQLRVSPVPVLVREELQACAAAFPGLQILLDVDEHLVVCADRLRLHQVLGNLVRNAQRYGRPPVRLAARPAGTHHAQIIVSDAGEGIPAEFVPFMFERHTRATGTGTVGTGIGLAVARELAERQSGTLEYEAEGNRFVLTLPRAELGAVE